MLTTKTLEVLFTHGNINITYHLIVIKYLTYYLVFTTNLTAKQYLTRGLPPPADKQNQKVY